tara:strand:+ start:345 stop:776 length:432 start_codon:yes stop_codon:yes gene_type:complete
MFDIGWQELLILAVLSIIVIGPKDLPGAVRTMTRWVRKARGMARELHNGLDDMVREAEINDIKDEANSIMGDHIDPDGIITRDLDLSETQRDWSRAIDDFKEATSPERNLDLDGVEGVEDIQEPSTLSDAKDGLKTQNNKAKA